MSKELFVKEIENGMEFTEFFMLKGMTLRTGANGKTYMDATLSDHTGEINCKKWDVSPDETNVLNAMADGDIVKVRGVVTEWNGILQVKVLRIRKAQDIDTIDMVDYIKAAPEAPEAMYGYIIERANAISDPDLKAVALYYLENNKDRLMYYPAAMRNHHAEMGGLLYHVKRMLAMGEKACEVYTGLDRDWVVCGVILHDMEKLNELQSNELGVSPGYTFQGKLLGHLVMGVREIEKVCKELNVSEEKTVMLEHMVLAHHYEPEFGSPLKPMFAEAELLHYLDMLDAKMFDFEEALAGTRGGQFSERVRTLDGRMLYKATFKDTEE